MQLFHRTTKSRADAVLARGFGDCLFTDRRTSADRIGVWLSESYFDACPRPARDEPLPESVLLAVAIPLVQARLHELDLGRRISYRLFLVPAAIVNRYPIWPVTAADEDRLALELDVQLRFGLSPKAARRRIAVWINRVLPAGAAGS